MGNEHSQDHIGSTITDNNERCIENENLYAVGFQHLGVEGRMLDKPTLPYRNSPSANDQNVTNQTSSRVAMARHGKYDSALSNAGSINGRDRSSKLSTIHEKAVRNKPTESSTSNKISPTSNEYNILSKSSSRKGRMKSEVQPKSIMPVVIDENTLKTSPKQHHAKRHRNADISTEMERKIGNFDNKVGIRNKDTETSTQPQENGRTISHPTSQSCLLATGVTSLVSSCVG